jgi:hypothetical protein
MFSGSITQRVATLWHQTDNRYRTLQLPENKWTHLGYDLPTHSSQFPISSLCQSRAVSLRADETFPPEPATGSSACVMGTECLQTASPGVAGYSAVLAVMEQLAVTNGTPNDVCVKRRSHKWWTWTLFIHKKRISISWFHLKTFTEV